MSKLGATALATLVVFLNPSAYAEERLDKYRYHSDGTYSKVGGSGERLGNTAPDPEVVTTHDPEVVDQFSGAGFIESESATTAVNGSSSISSTWSLRGSYGKNVSPKLHVQADADYSYTSDGTVASDELSGTAHVSTMVKDNVAVGGYVQAGLLGGDGSFQYSLGGEAIVFGEKTAAWARLGYGKVSLLGTDGDYIIGAAGLQYYINDNFRIDGEARVTEDLWSVHSRVNYRMERWPAATLHVGYQHIAVGGTSSVSSVDSVFAGVRYNFGSQTLKEEQQNGVRWQKIR